MKSITEKRQERQQATRKEYIEELDRTALQTVMETKAGRWFLMRLLDATSIYQTTFTGNSQTFFLEGRRSVGIDLIRRINDLGKAGIALKQTAEQEYIEAQEQFDAYVKGE